MSNSFEQGYKGIGSLFEVIRLICDTQGWQKDVTKKSKALSRNRSIILEEKLVNVLNRSIIDSPNLINSNSIKMKKYEIHYALILE